MIASPDALFRRPAARGRQSGSIVINTAIALSLIVIALVGTELGYLFVMKRELQKTADLAAIAGASAVQPTDCTAASGAALANAAQNLSGFTPVVNCGRWDPAQGTERNFTAGLTAYNAVHVLIEGAPPPMLAFFPGERTLHAEAVAAVSDPLAAFSVGSRLLRLEAGSLLPNILKTVGIGVSDTDVLSYQGLANASVTPSGLLAALGVPVTTDMDIGTLNELAAVQNLTLGQLLGASVTALQAQGADTQAQVQLLQQLTGQLKVDALQAHIPLLGDESTSGVLVATGDGPSGLGAKVNLLDLVGSSLAVANGNHFIEIPDLDVLGLVSAKVAVIEPPSIGIGGVGATAYTGQVRVYAKASTPTINLGLASLAVEIPIMIDVANAKGTLTEMCDPAQRTAEGYEQATIEVEPSLVKLCVGKHTNEANVFSTKDSCENNLERANLLKLSLLGVDLNLTTKLHADLGASSAASTTLPSCEDDPLQCMDTVPNTTGLDLGTTLQGLTSSLLDDALGNKLTTPSTAPDAAALAAKLWQSTATELFGTTSCGSANCRKQVLAAVDADIKQGAAALNNAVTGIGGLVTGLLNTIGNLLGGILSGLLGNACTGGLLFGSGTDAACRNEIQGVLSGNSSSGGTTVSNSLLATLGLLLDPLVNALAPALDSIGSSILTPLLDLLGIKLGQADVKLHTLSCQARAHLVY
ncbi:TadG family pilus assembly protein [Hydrogenophaga sp. 2FB]|uniref:TadG family pilus assembly protein n=1 Tax=Hydrogenophaga sp. 2FB TaxID=2502187 RepID=UPI0010F7D191|nr:TadG family pilus assembly protein [Hydrogenophaga sp. 2FB]